MLRLQRPRQPVLPLQLFALDLGLAAHLDLGHRGHSVELDAIQHRGEQFERLALVFLLRVLLRIAAQENALPHVIHRGKMFPPVLIQGPQHHFFFDVAHDLGAHAGLFLVIRLFERGDDFVAQARAVAGLLGLHPGIDRQDRTKVALDGLGQSGHVPLLFGRTARDVLIHHLDDHVLANPFDGLGHILSAHEVRALLIDHATLIVRDVVIFQQLLAGVEIVLLDPPLRPLDLASQHAALDRFAGLHAHPRHERLHPRRIAENTHQVIFERQVEAARARIALTAGSAAQLIVDAP